MAIGVLLALKESQTIAEAEQKIQSIRPEVSVNAAYKHDLKKLFPEA